MVPSPASPASPVTLRDIAKALGISHATVSRALHDHPRISLERRKQIQAEAARLGYRPNAIATALGQQRQHAPKRAVSAELAWINCWNPPERLRSFQEFELYWQGAYKAAARSGYRLQEFPCDGRLSLLRLEKILNARNIRGLLLPPQLAAPGWDRFDWEQFCVVRFGYSLSVPASPIVTSDQLANAMIGLDAMRRLGYRRIGFVTGDHSSTRFKAGFLMRQLDVVPMGQRVPVLMVPARWNEPVDYTTLPDWLRTHRPDAILSDLSSLPAAMAESGYRVPHDIGLASLSVLDGNGGAGLYQNSEAIGQAAVEMLISLLSHNHYGPPEVARELLITGRWMDGDSLPPRVVAAGGSQSGLKV